MIGLRENEKLGGEKATGATVKYTYSCGQKPLDGYTVKHGIGKGAFGEVYFGLSEGGKEVALKLIRDNSQIELRGIGPCLNLKHANLVHLYDLRSDARGDQWLIMEYVEGDSLRGVLDRHPTGVAPELAAEWFQGLAAGVQYLHDHGIVHRDLKPGNIFLEKGLIKVGDYSLCKLMDSERAAQTQSVGTVHYMAPEISTGNYNRQVDIYAAGVLLYELLVGKAPFDGDSAGEILMKHLTSLPDLSKVPSPFVPILDQALRKNPAQRFQTIAEMSKKVAQIVVAQQARQEQASRELMRPESAQDRESTRQQGVLPAANQETVAGTASSAGHEPGSPPSPSHLGFKAAANMLLYALLLAGLASLAWGTVFADTDWPSLARVFFPTLACSWTILILGQCWRQPVEESVGRRLTLFGLGLVFGLAVMWLDGHALADSLRPVESQGGARHPLFGSLYPDNQTLPNLVCYLGFYGLMMVLLRWWKLTELRRPEFFNLRGVAAAGIFAFVLLFLLPSSAERQAGFAAMVLTAAIVQLASPWEKLVTIRKKRHRLRGA